jgi:membrane-bound lytic murein transglycosylase B
LRIDFSMRFVSAGALAACLWAAVSAAPQNPPPPPPPPVPTVTPTPVTTPAVTPDPSPTPTISFEDWLGTVRAEALAKGISEATLDQAFAGLQPDPVIIARDRTQPELTQSLDDYITARMSAKTLARAAEIAKTDQDVIAKVHATYGIPGPIMVAIWGLESNFGQFIGVRPVITALATLAYDGRRPTLFRAELFQALAIVDKGLVALPEFIGSWAGAIGQPQFMPSSFLKYAVDFDGDGKIDIWSSPSDVLGSMANYLKVAGWTEGARWGREVKISKAVMARIEKAVPMRSSGCRARREMTQARPVSDWRELGVLEMNGTKLPAASLQASLVRGQKRNFLVYQNYQAIIEYNCSNAYAVSVGLIADRIAAEKQAPGK